MSFSPTWLTFNKNYSGPIINTKKFQNNNNPKHIHHLLRAVNNGFNLDTLDDLLRLHKLKDYLLQSNHSEDFKFVVYLPNSLDTFIHEKLRDVLLSPLYHIKDLEPTVLLTSQNCTDLIDNILQSDQPETLVCSSMSSWQSLWGMFDLVD